MKIIKFVSLLMAITLFTSCSPENTNDRTVTDTVNNPIVSQKETDSSVPMSNTAFTSTESSFETVAGILSLVTIGTGVPQYSETKANASTAIRFNDDYYIIDCGDGSFANMAASDFDYSQIKGILLTHHHLDHVGDFFDLYIHRALKTTEPLSIIGPPRTEKFVEFVNDIFLDDILYRKSSNIKSTENIDKDALINMAQVKEITGQESFFLNGLQITTAEMTHTMYNLAYRFDAGEQSIVISGDTSFEEDLISLSRDADILVIDGNLYKDSSKSDSRSHIDLQPFYDYGGNFNVDPHLNFEDMAHIASEANVATLVITHYGDTTQRRIDASIEELNKIFSGNVIYASDMQEISIDEKEVTIGEREITLTYPIVDTNQKAFYSDLKIIDTPSIGDDYYGQDASYAINQPSYTSNNDGTITDNITGLMWAQDMGAKMSYEDAFIYASNSQLAGYDDWRFPTIKELYSLIQFDGRVLGAQATDDLFIDTNYFIQPLGNTAIGQREIDAQTWSSTKYVGKTMNSDTTVFGVNFIDGRIKGYPTFTKKTQSDNQMYVRLVRDNPQYGANNFVDNEDGTITDLATGLTWQQSDSSIGMIWEDALSYAENLTLAGYDDWRLPNAKELQSIVNYNLSLQTTATAAIDPLFQTTPIQKPDSSINYPYFWTSTSHLDGKNPYSNAVYIAFGEAIGEMNGTLLDVHGAGAQRSDPKSGKEEDYPIAIGPQGDIRIVFNFARCVRSD